MDHIGLFETSQFEFTYPNSNLIIENYMLAVEVLKKSTEIWVIRTNQETIDRDQVQALLCDTFQRKI